MKKWVILLIFSIFFIFRAFTQTRALYFQRILPNKIDLIDENFWRAPYDSVNPNDSVHSVYTSNQFLIGNSITFNLLGDLVSHLKLLLEKVLSLSEATGIPVHIHLDGQPPDEWCEHLQRTYSFKDCRLLVIYNWEFMIDRDVTAQKGIRKFLSGSA